MLKNREGEKIPSVRFRVRENHEWRDVASEDVFKGQTVVVFSLPGAFTPTCSSSHVPRYNQLAPEFKRHGVDEIICISVNDAFVMNEWKDAQRADSLRFLPDGNGEFTEKMGMLVDKDELGFGKRSWRYSMLVKDGIIKKMFIEPEVEGDPYQVSDADTMLEYLAPQSPKPYDITVLSRMGCPHCVRAKAHLVANELRFEELVLNRDYSERTLRAVAGATTTPQIFVNGQHIGSADSLEAWLEQRAAA
ncbi:MAG: glutathione peroxidase [Gammaproteobacteria bacterium]|nr:glutathione peroxidase [Gammaproteobacteria bacterium]MDH3413145.1 glutathione peroxidase [Gammaproteobacteria bacterium]